MDPNQAEVERLVGVPVVSVQHAEWGFTNRTDVVTLPGGGRVVLQRYANRPMAAHRLQITAALAEPLRHAGIPTPRVLREDLSARPPYALLEELPGVPGQVAAEHDLSAPLFDQIAVGMGEWVPRLAAVPTRSLRLPRLWADPDRLAALAVRWLDTVTPMLAAEERYIVAGHIAAAPVLLADRPGVVAHAASRESRCFGCSRSLRTRPATNKAGCAGSRGRSPGAARRESRREPSQVYHLDCPALHSTPCRPPDLAIW